MRKIIIKPGKHGTELYVDGTKIDQVISLKITQEASSPMLIEIRALITSEVRVDS